MPKLKDIFTLEELEKLDRIQKQMDAAQTINEVRILDQQLQQIINHANARFNKIYVPGSLLITDVLSKEKEAEFNLLIKGLQTSQDFMVIKELAKRLTLLLTAEERDYYQNKIKNFKGGNEIIETEIISLKSIPREVKSIPQHVINKRRRDARKQRIDEVQQKIKKILNRPLE